MTPVTPPHSPKIIIVCIFTFVESFCPSSDSSEKFEAFLNDEAVWQLPTVVFDWKASPPPPPPVSLSSRIAAIALQDPEGWALGEEILDDYFPRLNHVLSKKAGSIINNKYGPKYHTSKYEASIAFLATEHFEDADSISARMIQARFSGYGVFSCKALVEFMSDPANAAAGSSAPEDARKDNPAEFNSNWDRNWLLIFASLFTESLMRETGVTNVPINPLSWWTEQCEEPASYRTPKDPNLWTNDRWMMQNVDAFGNVVEARAISPLLAYGPLRQFRTFYDPLSHNENAIKYLVGRRRRAQQQDEDRHDRHDRRKLRSSKILYGALNSATAGAALSDAEFNNLGLAYNTGDGQNFVNDFAAMRENVLVDMLQSVVCNPQHSLTIEEVMGDPPPFDSPGDDKYDSSTMTKYKDLTAPASVRGNGNFDKKLSQEEDSATLDGNLNYRQRSMQQWVYLTSSDDPMVLPGWHRLAQLRAWPDYNCNELPKQTCGYTRNSGLGLSTTWTAISQVQKVFSSFFSFFGRRLSAISTYTINDNSDVLAGAQKTTFRTGVETILSARCSSYLWSRDVPNAQRCVGETTAWYVNNVDDGCTEERIELLPIAEYRSLYSYISRFYPPSPPLSPPPRPPPPLPPQVPNPNPPPSPPAFNTRGEALKFASKMMENFCDSVYIISAESRCNALAVEMHTQFELADFTWNPPNLPPIAPGIDPPPPPPLPPSPLPPLEERRLLRLVPIYRATLSTYFLPTVGPSPPPDYGNRRALQYSAEAGGDPSEWTTTLPFEQRAALDGVLDAHHAANRSIETLVACTQSTTAAAAPLPCRTGVNPIRCLDGARACGTGDENGRRPFLELDFEDYEPDFNGRMYLFAVHFKIPSDEEFGSLLFHPPEIYGGNAQANRGWELTAYDESHNPLSVQCQDWNIGANAAEHADGLIHVTHACLPATAADSDYDVLSHARFLRITLIGEYRQIWLDNVDVYYRAITDVAPRPPPPPPPPGNGPPAPPDAPRSPSPPPELACFIHDNLVYAIFETYLVEVEPCALTREECCAKANERRNDGLTTNAFVISATGCCSLLNVPEAMREATPDVAYQFGVAGTGVLE